MYYFCRLVLKPEDKCFCKFGLFTSDTPNHLKLYVNDKKVLCHEKNWFWTMEKMFTQFLKFHLWLTMIYSLSYGIQVNFRNFT